MLKLLTRMLKCTATNRGRPKEWENGCQKRNSRGVVDKKRAIISRHV